MKRTFQAKGDRASWARLGMRFGLAHETAPKHVFLC
jgi:hypothetical protein